MRKAQLVTLGKSGKPNTFITLTVNPAVGEGPDDRAASLAASWRLIVKRAKRRYKYRRLPFLAVFEKTKNGEPHLHILARCQWIDQKWLSTQMKKEMGAPVVDIRRVKSIAQAAAYIAKYMAKDPHRFGSSKRYWTTQDWKQWRPDYGQEGPDFLILWEVAQMSVRCWVMDREADGWHCQTDGDRAVATAWP